MVNKKLFLNKVTLIKSLRGFRRGFPIDFDSDITILVGDNGTGKTTLLDLIRSCCKVNSFWKSDLSGYAIIEGKKT